jgi:zinc transport system permease protein
VPEFLGYSFMHRAFIAGAVTALICPAIGVFLIPRRLSLIADSLAHVALAGVAIGLLVGFSPVLGALVVTVAGAVGIERLRSHGALQGDASLAVFLSAGFAVAVVIISLARGFNADLFAILFGSILTVSPTDIWLILALGAVVAITIRVFFAQLFAITLSEELARTSGVPVTALNLMLTLLTALTIVVAMRMVGVLLVSAMIVIPALTGFTVGRSFRSALAIAIATALLSVVTGLIAAFYLRLAAGGAIVLTTLLCFAAASMARSLRRRAAAQRGLATAGLVLAVLAPGLPVPVEAATCASYRASFAGMPSARLTLRTSAGAHALTVRVADTPERQAAGFQCATPEEIERTLILFDFGQEIQTRFHMENVARPLDIAFAKADGRIFSIQQMTPGRGALYGPLGAFRYALEARAGFFAKHGIEAGAAWLVPDGP